MSRFSKEVAASSWAGGLSGDTPRKMAMEPANSLGYPWDLSLSYEIRKLVFTELATSYAGEYIYIYTHTHDISRKY